MKLGIILDPADSSWIGGAIYMQNVLRSLCSSQADVEILVWCQRGRIDGVLSEPVAQGVQVIETSAGRLPDAAARLVQVRSMLKHRIDVLFGSLSRLPWSPVPWIGWIPDFQHVRLPEHFSPAQRSQRDRIFRRVIQRSSRMIFSSQDAFGDFTQFAPGFTDKGHVVPFVSLFPEAFYEPDPEQTVCKFNIQRPFALTPNQWWAHKNHETLIRAAGILRQRGVACQFVLTGALSDVRASGHISHLLQLMAELNVQDRFVLLGLLPRAEQVQLQRAADIIVQPSLFEGWSTVVEDAKTLGKTMVVSDIAVHREQQPPGSLFFEPADAVDLADKIQHALGGAGQWEDEQKARQDALQRARVFSDAFLEVCRCAAARSSPPK
ncbi:MAG: glycosyltransferase family 4 protein [Armatimonadetes bacterium]|nr:glycosyltransferase family 4 protein [Armatimonadota bacterium]